MVPCLSRIYLYKVYKQIKVINLNKWYTSLFIFLNAKLYIAQVFLNIFWRHSYHFIISIFSSETKHEHMPTTFKTLKSTMTSSGAVRLHIKGLIGSFLKFTMPMIWHVKASIRFATKIYQNLTFILPNWWQCFYPTFSLSDLWHDKFWMSTKACSKATAPTAVLSIYTGLYCQHACYIPSVRVQMEIIRPGPCTLNRWRWDPC